MARRKQTHSVKAGEIPPVADCAHRLRDPGHAALMYNEDYPPERVAAAEGAARAAFGGETLIVGECRHGHE
jgi:hypothetical protein